MKSKYKVSVDFTLSGDILFEIWNNEISLKNISLIFFNERIMLGQLHCAGKRGTICSDGNKSGAHLIYATGQPSLI